MRRLGLLLFIVACQKSQPNETVASAMPTASSAPDVVASSAPIDAGPPSEQELAALGVLAGSVPDGGFALFAGTPPIPPVQPPPRRVNIRFAQPTTNGRLPPEVIQRIVRQSINRFRACYESALRRNPKLTGRVATKFVIATDGLVSMAQDGGSDIGDAAVVQCVAHVYSTLVFPPPESGIVTAVYPIIFSPPD